MSVLSVFSSDQTASFISVRPPLVHTKSDMMPSSVSRRPELSPRDQTRTFGERPHPARRVLETRSETILSSNPFSKRTWRLLVMGSGESLASNSGDCSTASEISFN
jgi:hypothetical protein